MSLRMIHIFFISAADSLCIFFGIWSIRQHLGSKEMRPLLLAISSFLVSLALVWYLIRFIKKSRNLNP